MDKDSLSEDYELIQTSKRSRRSLKVNESQ